MTTMTGAEWVIITVGVGFTLGLLYMGWQQEKIRKVTETTHRIVNNDHTLLVGRLVAALDRLGDTVTDAERREAATPIVGATDEL